MFFSDLNNLRDISFSEEFADICGITEKELRYYFPEGIRQLAEREGVTYEEACNELKLNYDGYRFSRSGSDIYNPWSVLNAMRESSVYDYWAETGKPTIVVEALRALNVDLEKILNTECTLDQLKGLDLSNIDPLPLLYQTGYLTIKDYDRETKLFKLGVPNKEVTRSLFNELLPYYISVGRDTPDSVARDIMNAILKGEPVRMMENINTFLAAIPYEMKMEDENNFHNALYILLTLIGARTETEVHTSDGRIDLVVKTTKFIYIIELKFGKSSRNAIDQIENKRYDWPYLGDSRRIFRIGANFNPATRRLDPPEIR
ncbi:MAG: ATP-binding protein [Muribaculaceae bacterium]|nr:ATP-binding protein [Muribaculaceae bacterium]